MIREELIIIIYIYIKYYKFLLIFLIQRNKDDNSRCHNGKDGHEIDVLGASEQQVAQTQPQKDDAH